MTREVTVPTDGLDVHPGPSQGAATLRREAEAHAAAGRHAEAMEGWAALLADEPEHPQGIAGTACALIGLGRVPEAVPLAYRLIAADTFHPASLMKLGSELARVRRHAEAIAVLRCAARNRPTVADAWRSLGVAQLGAELFSDAIASFRRAILLQPTSAAPHCDMALALFGLNRLPEAVAASQRALAIEPASPAAIFSLGCALLAMGRFAEGWAHYRLRFAEQASTVRHAAQPWVGEPLAGKRILVLGEQTDGDYIQFSRYLVELAELGADVTATVPKRLHRLFATLPRPIALIEAAEDGAGFDVQCPLFDLPHYLGLIGRELPRRTPYLWAEPERVARWRERIGSKGFRIGVAWDGSRPDGTDLNRSFPLEALWPVARLPGVRLISLQFRSGTDQIPRLPPGMAVEELGDGFESDEHGFLDAAAVMGCMDLVISLDSALVHLAGALGCRTWVALNHAPEWRWQRGRTDSPWYPTALLFRQAEAGDWDGVFTRMAEALREIVPAPGAPARPKSMPLAPASCGEVLDKITILEIKERRLAAPEAVADVRRELRHLRAAAEAFGGADADLAPLRTVNERLWDVEDALRACEAEGRFGDEFVALARSVYALNDERAAIKRGLNAALGSELVEHKSYGEAQPARG